MSAQRWDYLPMEGLHSVFEIVLVVAYVGLAALTFGLWRQRRDKPSFWVWLTFVDLGTVALAGQVLEQFEDVESALLDYFVTLLVAVLLLFPYFLYRVAHAFSPAARVVHLTAAIPTAIVVIWAIVVPRFPDEGEVQPTWFRVFAFAVLFQWVLCSFLVAFRFWRAGSAQPPITRKRMRMMSLAATGLSITIVISVVAGGGGEPAPARQLVQDFFSLSSAVAFYFAFVPPGWLRAGWRRATEDDTRRAIIDLMGAVTDEAVVDVLLPHATSLIGAKGIAMFDTDGNLVGAHGGDDQQWRTLDVAHSDSLAGYGLQKHEFPFGCLVVKTSPYTLFFGRDEIELLGALGVMTNLALERVRASEMRLEIAESQIRRQQALQINDNVVQGLAVAKYAFDLDDLDKAREAIEGTLAAARRIISDLLDEVGTDEVFGPKGLTRDTAATGFVTKDR